MNAAHLHLAINHFPIAASSIGIVLLIFGLIFKKEEWIKASWIVFLLAALFAIPTYLSGERAEDLMNDIPGVMAPMIEPHERMALYALLSLTALGLVSVIGLAATRRGPIAPLLINLTLALSIFSAALVAFTANLGGQIHHPEIRPALPAATDKTHGP